MNFDCLDRAGLLDTDFAKIIGVPRVYVSRWRKGLNPRKSSEHYTRAVRALEIIEAAVNAAKLPYKGMDADARRIVVTKLAAKINGQ